LTEPAPDTMKVLVVDDIPENLVAMNAILRRLPVTVLTAGGGREALEILLANDIALALVDVQMPEMDGFELAELMRGSHLTKDVPIIFVTAASRETHRVFAGYEAGAVDFLFKPVDPHVLRSKVTAFVELHQRKRELERQLRWNELLTAAVGHDLKNPLNAMLLAADLLSMDVTTDEQKRTLARLVRAGRRMSRLIDDLFDLARARRAERIELVLKDGTDLGEVVASVVAELVAANSREVRLERTGMTRGRWDPDRLIRVVSNLLGNALRHGDAKQPIRLAVDGSDKDEVVLTIANGGNIPADIIPYVWDPFRSGSRTGGGLGLGLYIVKELVTAHQGTVSVETGEGETRFVVRLPRAA
jgi:two-component system, sensor histidine kinase and response regulator